MGAESHPGRDVNAHLVKHVTRKSNRVIPLWHRRPHIEGRSWWLDVPAELVQRSGDQPVTLRIDLASRARFALSPIQRLDRRPLHGLEDAGVDVGLQLPDQADEV